MNGHIIKATLVVLSAVLCFPYGGFAGDEPSKTEPEMREIKLEPIVVTATRTEQNIEEIASSVSVITAEEIEATKASFIKETLRRVPGLDVVRPRYLFAVLDQKIP